MQSHEHTGIERVVLPSGLTILIETLPHLRSAALGYTLRSGSAAEAADFAGATHFLEHLVFKGTPTRDTAAIAAEIDALGGDVDAWTGKEYTSFHAHVLDEQIDDALDLLTDILLRPRYSDEDLEMERGVILEEIRMVEDTPDDLVHELFLEQFWRDHPLGRPILGPEAAVKGYTRESLEHHYREVVNPRNIIFAASGNIRLDDVLPILEREFGPEVRPFEPVEWSEPSPDGTVNFRRKSELEQVQLCLGMSGIPMTSEERYAAAILSTILGGGMSSRLFQQIREREGLVYGISAHHNGHRNAGYEAVYAACVVGNLPKVIEMTLAEIRSIRADGVKASELDAARRHLKGSILLSLESTVSRMSGMVRQEYYFGRQISPDEIIARIESVSLDDLSSVAQKILNPDTASLTLVGNIDRAPMEIDQLRSAMM